MKKKLKMIDLFAGIGGFHTAAANTDSIETVFASDIDPNTSKVYELNYGLNSLCDITKVKEEEIPKHDIIAGGFPCQAFSIAGARKGFDDTRGTLFFDVARIIKHHKPMVVFLENVKGLELETLLISATKFNRSQLTSTGPEPAPTPFAPTA